MTASPWTDRAMRAGRIGPGLVHGLRQGVQRQLPDLLGILLGPVRARREDGILAGGSAQDFPLAAEHDGLAAGRADIQAYDGHENLVIRTRSLLSISSNCCSFIVPALQASCSRRKVKTVDGSRN